MNLIIHYDKEKWSHLIAELLITKKTIAASAKVNKVYVYPLWTYNFRITNFTLVSLPFDEAMEYYCTRRKQCSRHYRIIILLNFHTNSELTFQWKCSGFYRGLVRETIATQSNSPPDLSSESLWSLLGSLFSGKCNEISSVGRLFVVRRRIRVSVDLWSMAFVSRSFCTNNMSFVVTFLFRLNYNTY